MRELLICCSPEDREAAQAIAARLERSTGFHIVVDDSDSESVAAKGTDGLTSSSAILLLLSPGSVPPGAGREHWGQLLDHIASRAEPPVASLLLRECRYPRLLERAPLFAAGREAPRRIEAWAVGLESLPRERCFEPARLPWFEGRDKELEWLWDVLVDRAGAAVLAGEAPACGKTSLAQEFCLRAREHFLDIVWCACGDRSLASIVAELAEQLEAEIPEAADDMLAELVRLAGRHRTLLVFDGLSPALRISTGTLGRGSVLVTARSLAEEMEHASCVLRLEPRPGPALEPPGDPAAMMLWRAMAVCSPGAVPADFAARVAGIDPAGASAALARLVDARLAEPLDELRGLLRLSAASVAAAGEDLEEMRSRHARLLREEFSTPRRDQRPDRRLVVELARAFRWALHADWPLAASLARHGFDFLRQAGRVPEGVELLTALRDAAIARGDGQQAADCDWELHFVQNASYRGPARAPAPGDQFSFDFSG
jgi:hypothetical protein